MTKVAAVRRRFAGLGFRLMAVMGVALLPLAILSYVQGVKTAQLAEARVTNVIKGETLIAANPLIAEIVKAQAKAATLAAALPSVLRTDADASLQACRNLMDRVVSANIGIVTFAGYVDRAGQMRCGARGEERDLAGTPAMQELLTDPGPKIAVNPYGPVSKTSVLIVSNPVFDVVGDLLGFAFVSMPHSMLDQQTAMVEGEKAKPLALVTFDAKGSLLTSSVGMEAAQQSLPANRPLTGFTDGESVSFVARTVSGERRAFSVVPIEPGTLYLLGSWPANRLHSTVFEGAFPAFLFPMMMWAASLLVAWLAAESQVLRHVRLLRDRITAFAAGERQLPGLRMEGAAMELRSVGLAYERMTTAVLRNEADLENTIHQKEVLLREVHHRVKNNLQLIASILNMQLRAARTNEAKEAMRTVQDRVISLATVHRELYQTSGLTDVRADELLPRVANDLLRIGSVPGRRFDMDAQVDDIRLTPDQAVPLALFLTEGMANVIKHSWLEGTARARVGLRLERTGDGRARFSLCNGLMPQVDDADDVVVEANDGFGSQLLLAFSQQLNGTVTRGRSGDGYVLTLDFPLRPLTEGEERVAPKPETAVPDDIDDPT
ncbi:MAG: sensor histidine kinase [Pseudotabrizicola sp.]|uniref:sensor histidine kinase n=1 Tax=Pseudotabrizicola sp. TaxID=2939647 RepID=UPI002718DD44|nr:sensor histidine kinase [Pseudotabrizicola sp.]MDO8882686.1 sensor histidine kinase [Pseudotabrizicola sp.]MDP2081462.1 sensor histidine kinase [Pseudotabrizicola sp.]MDZ7572975.1 sensor histidine kinase [Pseudotabrizicola sp.]